MTAKPIPESDACDDAVNERPSAGTDTLDPKHLGHGVHVRSAAGPGMHVEDSALPRSGHTGAGLGGMQIGDSRF